MRDRVVMGMHGNPRDVTPNDDLEALTNTAFRINGQWVAEFVISVFDRQDETKAHAAEAEVMHMLRVGKGMISWDRIKYFVAVPRENVKVALRQISGNQVFEVGPTRSNGIMNPEVVIPSELNNWRQGDYVVFEVLTPPEYIERHTFTTVFAEETGWGVISGIHYSLKNSLMVDIDDTIKISEVRNRVALLKHTFIDKQGQPVAGMPDLYRTLIQRLNFPTFFYLSASPWQLYLFIREFVDTNYPFGQIILRDMSYLELSSFISSLTIGTQDYKMDRIDKIHRWFPHKEFLCIGDSTQRDPETYAAMYVAYLENLNGRYRKYPGWIKQIWIRVVEGVDPKDEKELNAMERFEKAFSGVPRYAWRIFKDPRELVYVPI